MPKKKTTTIEELGVLMDSKIDGLAVAIKKGFDAVDDRFNAVDERFDSMDKRFDGIEAQIVDLREEVRQNKL